MNASRKTLADAKVARAHFKDLAFTEEEYRTWNDQATRIQTLERHGIVTRCGNRAKVLETMNPQEFIDYVREDLYVGGCYSEYEDDIVWDESSMTFQFVKHMTLYRFA